MPRNTGAERQSAIVVALESAVRSRVVENLVKMGQRRPWQNSTYSPWNDRHRSVNLEQADELTVDVKNNLPTPKAAFAIFMETICDGLIPAWYDDRGFPVVYETEREAQLEIADSMIT